MAPAHDSLQPTEAWQKREDLIRRFEAAWLGGQRPALDKYLSEAGAERRAVLLELAHADLEFRLEAGDAARVEEYLQRYPEMGQDPAAVLELIAAEHALRRPREAGLSPDEYFRRFPQYRPALEQRLRPARPAAAPRLAIDSVAGLVQVLRDSQLLRPGQRGELPRLQESFTEPRGLAKELLQRNWLTPFQVNQLFLGRGHEIVLGPYVLLERVGEGGMGSVFKARHQLMDRVVALKVIRKDRLADAETVRRFHREIRAAAQLSHPNIVTAHDASQVGDTHFLVMEYVEGTDLRKLLQKRGPLPVVEACEYVRQAAQGLQHAHEKGLVHRDLKPANLLLTAQHATVKILDMGLARLRATGGEETAGELTEEGAVMGTPDYMAPEQARESHTVDIRADLYSLGCTLFFLLTGQPPFPGGTLAQKLVKHQTEAPPPLEQRRPDAPPTLGAVLRRLLAKRLEERYQTPAEVVLALEPFCWVQAPRALPTGSPHQRAQALPVARLLPAGPAEGEPTARIPAEVIVRVGLPRGAPQGSEETLPPSSADSVPVVVVPAAPGRARRGRRWRVLAAAGAGLLGVLLLTLFWPRGDSPQPGQPPGTPPEQQDADTVPPADRIAGLPEDKVRLVAVLGEHRARVPDLFSALALSPDGKLLAVGSSGGALLLVDPETLRELHRVPRAHQGQILGLAFSPDGKRLASGGEDQFIRWWDVDRKQEVRRLAAAAPVRGVAFVNGGQQVLSNTNAGKLQLWDGQTGEEIKGFFAGDMGQRKDNHPRRLAVAPNGREFVSESIRLAKSGTFEVGLVLWSLATGKIIRRFKYSGAEPIIDLAYSPDGSLVLSSHYPNTLRWWNPRTGAEVRPLAGDMRLLVAFSPDGRHALSAGGLGAGHLRLWSVPGGQELLSLPIIGSYGGVFLPDNHRAVFSDQDNLRMLDVETGKELRPPVGHTKAVSGVTFSRDGRLLLSWGQDDTLRLWDVETRRERKRFAATATGAVLSPGSRFALSFQTLAGTHRFEPLSLWDVETGVEVRKLAGHAEALGDAVFPTDDLHVLTAGLDTKQKANGLFDASVRRWDVITGKSEVVCTIKDASGWFRLSPDGRKALVHHSVGSLALWDLGAGRALGRWEIPFNVSSQIPDHDVRRWFFGGDDGSVGVFDLQAGGDRKLQPFLRYHDKRRVQAIALAPDGATLATGDADGRVILWDTAARTKWCEWRLPSPVNGMAFAPDGRHLATANANGTVYVLRLTSLPARAGP